MRRKSIQSLDITESALCAIAEDEAILHTSRICATAQEPAMDSLSSSRPMAAKNSATFWFGAI